RESTAVDGAEDGFEVAHLALFDQGFDEEIEPLGAGPDIEIHEGLADDFIFCQPERSHQLMVHIDDDAVAHGSQRDIIDARVEYLAQHRFAALQFSLLVFALGNIVGNRHHAARAAQVHYHRREQDGNPDATLGPNCHFEIPRLAAGPERLDVFAFGSRFA